MRSGLNLVSVWFGAVMILVVLTGAIAITVTDFMDDRLYGAKRVFFVILLLAYAIYRIFRLRQALKQMRNNDE
jgi:hypothetical protein